MTAEHVEVVCRLNQVRSPFLASFLERHFLGNVFTSSGILASKNTRFDSRARGIAIDWGFEYPIRNSLKFSALQNDRVLLPVDHEIREFLIGAVSTGLILNSKLEATSLELNKPLDPLNSDSETLRYELAKLLGYGTRQIFEVLPSPFQPRITAYMPRNADSYKEIFEELLPQVDSGETVVIDAGLKQSNFKVMEKNGFNMRHLMMPFEQGVAYSNVYEVPESEKLFCSPIWKSWLFDLAKNSNVVIVTPPRENLQGRRIFDSFLAAIWSQNIVHV